MAEKKLERFDKFEKGMTPDDRNRINLPGWVLLENLWLSPVDKMRSRPFLTSKNKSFTNIYGFGITHDNQMFYVADGKLFVNKILKSAIGSTRRARSDVSRATTIICAGGKPIVWDGTSTRELSAYSNVYTLATFSKKLRLATVSSDNKRKITISALGNINDIGTIITDSDSVNDEKTEGYYITNIPYDIIDIVEKDDNLIVFTKQAIFTIEPTIKDWGFSVKMTKVAEVEVFDTKVIKLPAGEILFFNSTGVMNYPGLSRIEMNGISKTIRDTLVSGQVDISFDQQRNLFYLKPNNTENILWVHNNRSTHWTRWDIPFIDIVTISNVTYGCTSDEVGVLTDSSDSEQLESQTVILHSGLHDFGDPDTRKVFKRVLINLGAKHLLEHFVDLFADEIPDNPVISLTNDREPFQIFVSYIGKKGKRGSLYIKLKITSELVIDDISVVYFEKDVRLGIQSI